MPSGSCTGSPLLFRWTMFSMARRRESERSGVEFEAVPPRRPASAQVPFVSKPPGSRRVRRNPQEQFLNGLPTPYSFPSSAFTVTRLPHSGRVLSVRVQGAYLPPEKEVETLRQEYEFGDSELFDGSLDDIAGVLARAHAKCSESASDKLSAYGALTPATCFGPSEAFLCWVLSRRRLDLPDPF